MQIEYNTFHFLVNIPFNLHVRPPFRKKVTLHLFSEYIMPDLQEKFNMGRTFY